ncbi:fatty acid desaturase [bacterium]|nr:fatty acid desaturase [bacterium]
MRALSPAKLVDRLLGTFLGRLAAAVLVYAATFACYRALNASLPHRVDLMSSLDRAIPFLPGTILVYLSFYGLMLAAAWRFPALEFRRLIVSVLVANAICYAGFALLTSHYPRPPLEEIDPLWRPFYENLRRSDGPGNTFPSTHVAVTCLLALRLARGRGSLLWLVWGGLIDLSTLTVKQHFVADVAGGVVVALVAEAIAFPRERAAEGERPTDLRPRHRLNAALAVFVVAATFSLQAIAARQTSWAAVVFVGVIHAALMMTLYSLLHEAWHRLFDSRPGVNDAFGFLLAAAFPCSFTFLRACHLGHHGRNRTDSEMFDLYYEGDRTVRKRAYFYFLYMGGLWLSIAFSNVILLLWEGFCRTKLLQSSTSAAAMVNGVPRSLVRRVRLECLGVIALHALMFWALDLRLSTWAVLWAIHAVSWSSQNYITHTGSPRHVTEGAHNLATHWVHERAVLNFNWHLAHHQNPGVPWHLLPRFDDPARERPGYLATFARFWRGPRLATEPSPRVEENTFFSV